MRTVPQTKGLWVSLSDCKDARGLGTHTQARSARFKTGRVLLSLPNKTPAAIQNRAFAESSSMMRKSERPKMVSSGSFKRWNSDIQ